jgi:hypothetical protein
VSPPGAGDQVFQTGNYNIGIINNQADRPAQDELRTAVAELNAVVGVLRSQVPAEDRTIIDAAMETIGSGETTERGSLRRALASLTGIASLVGDIGAPVIEAIRKVAAAFGWN